MGSPIRQVPSKGVNLTALSAVSDAWLVTLTDMIVGSYTLAHSTPPTTAGPRLAILTHATAGGTADTLGFVIVTGTDINGKVVSDTLVPVADSVVTGTVWFATVTAVKGEGWAIDTGGTPAADQIKVGFAAAVQIAAGAGSLDRIVVNTTAAGTIIVRDAIGVIATLKSSVGEGTYRYGCVWSGYLAITLAANSDITVAYT